MRHCSEPRLCTQYTTVRNADQESFSIYCGSCLLIPNEASHFLEKYSKTILFIFEKQKATLQNFTVHSGDGKGGNFKISHGNLYFLLHIRILH